MSNPACIAQGLKSQFSARSAEFDISAGWVTDSALIRAHIELAGEPSGKALDLCCGTGMIGRSLKERGWDVRGLDICGDMAGASSRHFPALEGMAERLPFRAGIFRLAVCRQTFQFLNSGKVLAEIARVLSPGGIFIVSLTVPFSGEDKEWLHKVHRLKQPLLQKFYTAGELKRELLGAGFPVREERILQVRESVNRWMAHSPELTEEARARVISMVENSPAGYKRLHRVEVADGEVFEDWNWVVFKTIAPRYKVEYHE